MDVHEPDQARIGRVSLLPAVRHLPGEEAPGVLRGGGPDRVVLRAVGLHDYPPPARPPARAACHLAKHLEGALARAEVGRVQAHVRQHHPDQGHAGEVQPLGYHLCADEDGRFAGPEALQQRHVLPGASHGVAVPPEDGRTGKEALNLVHDRLGADSEVAQPVRHAGRALGGRLTAGSAVVAQEQSDVPVVRGRRVATPALEVLAAAAALQVGSGTPPVQE